MIATIPPRETYGSDHLVFWENFLTREEIQALLALPNWHNVEIGSIGYSTETALVNNNKRMSNVAWFHPTEDTQIIWEKIVNTIADINAKFFHFDLTGCYEPAQLTLYKAEDAGHYDWHVDASPKAITTPRKLSMSLLLSDPNEFEGGELQVKPDSDDIKFLEQKQGRAWFFPSYTLHRVAPVTKGVRRSLVLWVGGPPFK
jgi:PKHD-type hydroxylase